MVPRDGERQNRVKDYIPLTSPAKYSAPRESASSCSDSVDRASCQRDRQSCRAHRACERNDEEQLNTWRRSPPRYSLCRCPGRRREGPLPVRDPCEPGVATSCRPLPLNRSRCTRRLHLCAPRARRWWWSTQGRTAVGQCSHPRALQPRCQSRSLMTQHPPTTTMLLTMLASSVRGIPRSGSQTGTAVPGGDRCYRGTERTLGPGGRTSCSRRAGLPVDGQVSGCRRSDWRMRVCGTEVSVVL